MNAQEYAVCIKKIVYCTDYTKEKAESLMKEHDNNLENILIAEKDQINKLLITRYTEYNMEQASEKLAEFDNDVKAVFNDYNKIVNERIHLLLSITNFTEAVIKEKMKLYRNNYQKVLDDYNDFQNNKIQCIMRQTDYTEEFAKERLDIHKGDHIAVIREFMGITEKKAPEKIGSLNQEIYKQIRGKLDTSMREYNERKENADKAKEIVN